MAIFSSKVITEIIFRPSPVALLTGLRLLTCGGVTSGTSPLVGVGAPAVKSAALLFVLVPAGVLCTEFVLLGAGVKPFVMQLVLLPYATIFIILAPLGQAVVSAVVLLDSNTLPAVADIAMLPIASGVGSSKLPPAPIRC